MKLLLLVVCAVQYVSGVIYSLNETEYSRLVPLFRLEGYRPCLQRAGDRYCYVDAELVANHSSELLRLTQEFSAASRKHYNHSLLHWGICVTSTCREFLNHSGGLQGTLEACLNSSLYRDYQLQARVVPDKMFCTDYDEPVVIDTGDYVVAAVCAVILMLNVVGSLFDFFFDTEVKNQAARLLLCFSVRRNWQRLTAPSGAGPEPRLTRFKSFNGTKALTTAIVILGHSPLAALIVTNNPNWMESTYDSPLYYVFYNGTLLVQTFFVLSGVLLSYNILLISEKVHVGWEMVPKGIMLRWLRLTPPYAVVLAIIATWLRYFGDGPLWKSTVNIEVEDCRRDWYQNLLYINNYVDNGQCMAHSWYLAADMQLSVLGLAIFSLLKSPRARKAALVVAFVVGLITPAVHIYLQDLEAIVLMSPEVARHYFVEDPTFNNLYKRGHTNITCYVLGLAIGVMIYNIQQKEIDVEKYKKYRGLVWAIFPVGILTLMTSGVFYADALAVPVLARALYAGVIKLVFSVMACLLILGCVFKIENVYRGILEWRMWAAPGRVAYSAYLVHVAVVRVSAANHDSLVHSSFFQAVLNYLGILCVSFALALPCWMLVEAPCNQLVKICFSPAKSNLEKNMSSSAVTQVVVLEKETAAVKL